mgnify:CR=1 FL=1
MLFNASIITLTHVFHIGRAAATHALRFGLWSNTVVSMIQPANGIIIKFLLKKKHRSYSSVEKLRMQLNVSK